MLDKILEHLWASSDGLLKIELKKKLGVSTFGAAQVKPLLQMSLLEDIKIQTGKKLPARPNGYRIAAKGVNYLQYVTKSSNVNSVLMVKEANERLNLIKDEMRGLQSTLKSTSTKMDDVRSMLDKVGRMPVS